jgi:hypothetical protein
MRSKGILTGIGYFFCKALEESYFAVSTRQKARFFCCLEQLLGLSSLLLDLSLRTIMTETSAAPTTDYYPQRRERFVAIAGRLSAAAVIVVLAFWLFWSGVKEHEPDDGKTAGWLCAPVTWLVISAYKKRKAIPGKDRTAIELKYPRLASKIALCFLILTIAGGLFSVALLLQQKRARSARVHSLLQEGKKLGVANTENRQAFNEVLARDVTTFAEFKQQADDLRKILDKEDEITIENRAHLLRVAAVVDDNSNAAALITTMQQANEEEAKVSLALRQMTLCADVLSIDDPAHQRKFREICVVTAQQSLAEPSGKVREFLTRAQSMGAKLPSDLAESLK